MTKRTGAARHALFVNGRKFDARLVLLAAMLAAAIVDLWLGRRTTFTLDEIAWFATTPGLDVHQALAPYNGHLILGARLVYDLMFHVFGVSYFPFRAAGIFCVFASVWLLFEFARPRVGGTAALGPCVVLLVFGSDVLHSLMGNAILDISPVAFGVAALLALEREDARGDLAACLFLIAAAATYSTGLAFIAGAAVLVVSRRRWERAWVFLVPGLLYVAWFIWASGQPAAGADQVKISNVLLAPIWTADSIGNVSAALAGLNYPAFGTNWTAVTGALTVVLTVLALRRAWSWRVAAILAVPLTFWVLGAGVQSPPMRTPEVGRYLLPGAMLLLLFAFEGARGLRWRRSWLIGIACVSALGLATNLSLLGQGGSEQRAGAITMRYDLAALEAAGGKLGASAPNPVLPGAEDPSARLWAVLNLTASNGVATGYLQAANKFGSLAYSEDELASLPLGERTLAVIALQQVEGVKLSATKRLPAGCREESATAGGQVLAELPRGGAVLESRVGGQVSISRFGSLGVPLAKLSPKKPAALVVPPDQLGAPWDVAVGTSSLRVCPLPGAP